jgi:hypothetical protein
MKYVRGRTFRNRARLDMTVDPCESNRASALLVKVSMHNEGASRIDLGLKNEKFVRVDAVFEDDWLPEANVDWDADDPQIRTYLFREHTRLEPNETITAELLVPLALPSRRAGTRVPSPGESVCPPPSGGPGRSFGRPSRGARAARRHWMGTQDWPDLDSRCNRAGCILSEGVGLSDDAWREEVKNAERTT